MRLSTLTFLLLLFCESAFSQTCSNLFVTFEGGTNGTVVTPALLSSNTFGNLQGYWEVDPGDGGITGFPGGLKWSTNAQHALSSSISVCGDGTQSGAGTLGLQAYNTTNSSWSPCHFNFSNAVSYVTVSCWLYWTMTNTANYDILDVHYSSGAVAYNNLLLSTRPTFAYIQSEISGCGTCTDYLTNSVGDYSTLPPFTWYFAKLTYDVRTNFPNMSLVLTDTNGGLVGAYTCYQPCPGGTSMAHVSLGVFTSSYLTNDPTAFVYVDSLLIEVGTNTTTCPHPTNEIACTYTALTNAIACAQEGDTILIDPGTATILDTININAEVSYHIKGSGTNSTILVADSGVGTVFNISSNSANMMTVSDMTCSETGAGNIFFSVGPNNPGTPLAGYVRLYNLSLTNMLFYGMSIGSSDSYTLVDHCNFVVAPGATNWNCVVVYGNQWFSWSTNGNQLGTIRQNVVEDCSFLNNSGNVGNGFFDGYNGGALTWRHNLCDGNAATGNHGYDSAVTSMKSMEVYNNIFTNIDNLCFGSRGGAWLFFSNTVYGLNPSSGGQGNMGPGFDYYRAVAVVPSVQQTLGYPGLTFTNSYSTNWTDGTDLQIGFSHYTLYSSITTGGHQNVSGAVLIGSDLPHTMTNLVACLNADTGAGSVYTAISTNAYPIGKSPNNDVSCHTDSTGTNLYMLNKLDGTNVYSGSIAGYPAAMAPGVLTMSFRTNYPAPVVYPMFQWSNVLHYSDAVVTNIVWVDRFEGDSHVPNYSTNLLQRNRDFFDAMIATNYTPLQYPDPLTGNTNPPPTALRASFVGRNLQLK